MIRNESNEHTNVKNKAIYCISLQKLVVYTVIRKKLCLAVMRSMVGHILSILTILSGFFQF